MALSSLTIKNLAVIEKTHIDFDNGLTVITGETGAGKSVILKAIALMLGARADNALIRHGENVCDVYADFTANHLPLVQEWLDNNDFDDDGNCVIRRVIKRDKGSKTYINGHPANLAQLKDLGQQLIDLHGQHEHQQLLNKAQQLNIIDALTAQNDNNHYKNLSELKSLHNTVRTLKARIESAQINAEEHASKIDLLNFQVQELEDLDLQDNEFSEINTEYSRLNHAQELIDGYKATQFDLSDNDAGNVESLLGRSVDKIQELLEYDPSLQNASELLNSALANVQEAKNDIRHTSSKTEVDPERLHFLEQRITSLVNIARKHRCDENELGSVFEKLSIDLSNLKKQALSPEALDEEIQTLTSKFCRIAKTVSQSRLKIAQQLQNHVTKQMQLLGMEGGFFEVRSNEIHPKDMLASGLDDIDFLVSGNPGMPAQSLNKVASGGELSRISLAIQILEGSVRRAPTLIFDEVDVGVGGGTAEIVGNSLRTLAANGQVLCITHLPQVASKGDHHLNVNKDKNQSTQATTTNIQHLNAEQRVHEIARMLGGIDITQNTLAHAKEMLGS